MTTPKERAQGSFDETLIEDSALERMFSDMQAVKDALKPINKERKELKDEIAQKMDDFQEGTYRVGRFVVTVTSTPGGHREFDTAESRRITFKLGETAE